MLGTLSLIAAHTGAEAFPGAVLAGVQVRVRERRLAGIVPAGNQSRGTRGGRGGVADGDIALNIATDLMIRDSERRCAAVLLRLSGRRFSDPRVPEPVQVSITQADLADAANLSLTSVRSMLLRLAERGLIEQGYRDIVCGTPPRSAPSSMRGEMVARGACHR